MIKLIKKNIPQFKFGNRILFAKRGIGFKEINEMYAKQAREKGKDWTEEDMLKLKTQWNKGDKNSFINSYTIWKKPKVNENTQQLLTKAATPKLQSQKDQEFSKLFERPREEYYQDYQNTVQFDPNFDQSKLLGPRAYENKRIGMRIDKISPEKEVIPKDYYYNKKAPMDRISSAYNQDLNSYNWKQDGVTYNVKKSYRDKQYNDLIKAANKKYGITLFNDRSDVAAFQRLMGLKEDGILGPETEALLDAYFNRTSNDSINTSGIKFYSKQSNEQVRNNTLNKILGVQDQSGNVIQNGTFDENYFNNFNTYINSSNKEGYHPALVGLTRFDGGYSNPAYYNFHTSNYNNNNNFYPSFDDILKQAENRKGNS